MLDIAKWIHILRDFLRKLRDDAVSAYAAQAVLFLIISFFPFAMLLLALLRYLPFTQAEIGGLFRSFLPDTVQVFIQSTLHELYTLTAGTVIPLTAVTALWSASRGAVALIRGLNRIYDAEERHGYFVLRAISTLYTVAFMLLLVILLGAFVFGSSLFAWLGTHFPALTNAGFFIASFRVLLLLSVLTLFFWLLYIAVPRQHMRLRTRLWSSLPGAVIAAGGWVGFSLLYSFYIDRVGNFSLYGSLTAVVLAMLWLYFCLYILFLGAEINVWLQQNAALLHRRKPKTDKK